VSAGAPGKRRRKAAIAAAVIVAAAAAESDPLSAEQATPVPSRTNSDVGSAGGGGGGGGTWRDAFFPPKKVDAAVTSPPPPPPPSTGGWRDVFFPATAYTTSGDGSGGVRDGAALSPLPSLSARGGGAPGKAPTLKADASKRAGRGAAAPPRSKPQPQPPAPAAAPPPPPPPPPPSVPSAAAAAAAAVIASPSSPARKRRSSPASDAAAAAAAVGGSSGGKRRRSIIVSAGLEERVLFLSSSSSDESGGGAAALPLPAAEDDVAAVQAAPLRPPEGRDACGRRVSVYFERSDAWYNGVISLFDLRSGRHGVDYDDGDTEQINLANVLREGHLRFLPDDDDKDDEGDAVARAAATGDVAPPRAARRKRAASPSRRQQRGGSSAAAATAPDAEMTYADAAAACPLAAGTLPAAVWCALACAGGTSARASAPDVLAFIAARGLFTFPPRSAPASTVSALITQQSDHFTRPSPGVFALRPGAPTAAALAVAAAAETAAAHAAAAAAAAASLPLPPPLDSLPPSWVDEALADEALALKNPFRSQSVRHGIWAALTVAGPRGLTLAGLAGAVGRRYGSCADTVRHAIQSDPKGAFVCVAPEAYALADTLDPEWAAPPLLLAPPEPPVVQEEQAVPQLQPPPRARDAAAAPSAAGRAARAGGLRAPRARRKPSAAAAAAARAAAAAECVTWQCAREMPFSGRITHKPWLELPEDAATAAAAASAAAAAAGRLPSLRAPPPPSTSSRRRTPSAPGGATSCIVGGALLTGGPAGSSPPKKYRFGRSSVHAWGLFAATAIHAEERIIEYVGELVSHAESDRREAHYTSVGKDNYLFRADDSWVIDATVAGNAARFINHSCAPNCTSRAVAAVGGGGSSGSGSGRPPPSRVFIVALRDIAVGEELFYDYFFEFDEADKIPCLCGAPRCRGFMN
jgi:hypothetical protein